MKMKPEDC